MRLYKKYTFRFIDKSITSIGVEFVLLWSMSIKNENICVSTKLIYSLVIAVLLAAIVFTLFPLNELFIKKDVVKITDWPPIINPTHAPPTEVPTPTIVQQVLFPDNPNAENAMRLLSKSKYGYSPYVLDIKDKNRPLFDGINGHSGNAIHYLEYQGTDTNNPEIHKFKVTFAMYPFASSLTEEFQVNLETNDVKPFFPSMALFDRILNPSLKKVQIPHTNKSLMLPDHFIIDSTEKTFVFSQSNNADMAEYCSHTPEYPYCKEYAQYLGGTLEVIGQKRNLGVSVRIIEWEGTPHEWALDNVSWQGKSYRETIKEYPDFVDSATVTLGNNDFYKIREGCCGDRSYSYITKGFSDNGTPLLIIFRAVGEQVRIEGQKGIRKMPYLEEILKTMN